MRNGTARMRHSDGRYSAKEAEAAALESAAESAHELFDDATLVRVMRMLEFDPPPADVPLQVVAGLAGIGIGVRMAEARHKLSHAERALIEDFRRSTT